MVHVDAGSEQERHRLDMGTLASRDQRIAAEAVADRQVGLSRQHHRDDLGAPARAGEEPWRVEVRRLRIHVRARMEERLGDRDLVRLDREEQRRAPLTVSRLDRRARGDKAANLAEIA